MAKLNRFKKGDLVSAKKLNGEHILGLYEYEYDDGDHCIFDGTKKYAVKKNVVKKATEEEAKEIQETVIKPMRAAKKKAAEEAARKQMEEETEQNEATSDEELEQIASEADEVSEE